MSSSGRGKCQFIPVDVIKDATDNFNESNVLGQGGESKVYLADIKLDWKITRVAVKHLKPNSQEFDNEIKIVSKIQHPNILSLLGYCDESGQKILLYEYMENGSLSGYLRKNSSIRLSWLQRLHICIDAARGLQHLHDETDEFPKGIVHRDVKPDNILLDKDWVAKISDFGMFKVSIAGQLNSTMNTNLKGTSGYYAPEYIAYRAITRKIDVYAFGVVLFQVLCLKMPWDRGDESYYSTDDEDLGGWALQNVDVKLKEEISDDSLNGFTALIGKALKKDPRQRPTMNGVVLELQKVLNCQEHSVAGSRQEALRFDLHPGVKPKIGSGDRDETIIGLLQTSSLEGLGPQWITPRPPRLPVQDGEGIPEQAEVPPPAQAPLAGAQPINPPVPAPQAAVPSGGPNANPLDIFPQGIPAACSNADAGKLDFLRNSQQFQALRAMVQANPQLLQPMLQELAKQNPDLLRLIQDNQADFLELINEPVEEEVEEEEGNPLGQLAGAMPQAVTVTPEEREAIERLEATGFDRGLVLEVFFACNKNEELAANYLLDHMHEFDD